MSYQTSGTPSHHYQASPSTGANPSHSFTNTPWLYNSSSGGAQRDSTYTGMSSAAQLWSSGTPSRGSTPSYQQTRPQGAYTGTPTTRDPYFQRETQHSLNGAPVNYHNSASLRGSTYQQQYPDSGHSYHGSSANHISGSRSMHSQQDWAPQSRYPASQQWDQQYSSGAPSSMQQSYAAPRPASAHGPHASSYVPSSPTPQGMNGVTTTASAAAMGTPYQSKYRSQLLKTPQQSSYNGAPLSQPSSAVKNRAHTSSATNLLATDYSALAATESRKLMENFHNAKNKRPQPSDTRFSVERTMSSDVVPNGTTKNTTRATSANPASTNSTQKRPRSSFRTSSRNRQDSQNVSQGALPASSFGTKSFPSLHDHADSVKRDLSTQKYEQAKSGAEQEYARAMEAYDNLHFDDALKLFQKALNLVETGQDNNNHAPGDHVEVLANIFLGMGIVYYAQGRDKAALELYNRCIDCLKEKFGSDYPGMVSALVNIGLIYTNQKRYEDALSTFLQAQRLAENVLGMDRLSLADIYHNIGVIYDSQGKNQDALNYYKRSLRIREKLLGEHPITALTYENMAMIYKDLKQYSDALSLQSKVLNIRKTFVGTENVDFALALHNLGLVYKGQHKYKKALTYLQKALKIRRREFGDDHELTQDTKQVIQALKNKMQTMTKRKQSMFTL